MKQGGNSKMASSYARLIGQFSNELVPEGKQKCYLTGHCGKLLGNSLSFDISSRTSRSISLIDLRINERYTVGRAQFVLLLSTTASLFSHCNGLLIGR